MGPMCRGRRSVFAALAGLVFLSPSRARAGECAGFTIYPPDSAPYGRTLGEWGEEWWKWALSFALDGNPITDSTGEFCHAGQPYTGGDDPCRKDQGPVFFLAGNFGGRSNRRCAIPCGRPLLFPVVCSIMWVPDDCQNCAECVQKVVGWMDQAADLDCKLDGVSIPNLKKYRGLSPECHCFVLPEPNPFGIPSGKYAVSASDGIWLMIEPLCPGEHTISWRGRLGDFALEISYQLTVEACEFRRGDATGDGQMDLADPIRILNYMFVGGTLQCLAAADLDDDGQILLNDPIYLLTYLFSIGPAPQPPFPACGPDPTPAGGPTCDRYLCP